MPNDHSKQFEAIRLNIIFYRKKKNLTQQKLAEMVNVSRTHLSNVEALGSSIFLSFDLLFDIADALEVPVEKLFEIR